VNLTVASASTAITSTGMAGSFAGLGYAVHYDPEGASKMDAMVAGQPNPDGAPDTLRSAQ
jgi:hypothetical protein